jgi:murein DD-endopeptidase MepM/ murein hydrolase activator NlpD
MMNAHRLRRFATISVVTCIAAAMSVCTVTTRTAYAASSNGSSVKSDVDTLSSQIDASQKRVKELDNLISNYQKNIELKKGETATLENQLALLDNRIKEKELGVERAKTEIETLNLEISLISDQIGVQTDRVDNEKQLIADLVRKINKEDDVTTFDALLAQPSLSGLFARMEELKQLQSDLGNMLVRVKTVKASLEQKKQERLNKQKAVEEERRRLKAEQLSLEGERNLKTSLVSETKLKETEFERILYELNQQQQSTAEDISLLESKLKEKLDSVDQALARGDILINWPVDPSKGITAIFHDPTYPFRYLFEHPGTDIRATVGTPVKAAAGGYVAWNKTGRMYGNYMMIVHPGGIATVYAHLSKFIAKPDTYVERQEVIALSGGKPGAPGAGLSTGPHLHFEVRQDGIPVDAENFLPQIPNDYYDSYDEYHRLKLR